MATIDRTAAVRRIICAADAFVFVVLPLYARGRKTFSVQQLAEGIMDGVNTRNDSTIPKSGARAIVPDGAPPQDPRPVRPVEPDAESCCGEGCVRCVFDIHEEKLERYEAALAAWKSRQS